MQEITSLLSALFCIGSRTALSLYDRSLFGQKKEAFYSLLLWNSLLPLLIALALIPLFSSFDAKLLSIFFDWKTFCNGLAAQITATAFSYAFQQMPIRSVIVSSKLTDLFLPFLSLLFTKTLQLHAFMFSQLTTLVFIPLALFVIKKKELQWMGAVCVIGSLLFQAALSLLLPMETFSQSWIDFIRLMVCLMGWRVALLSIGLFHSKLRHHISFLSFHSLHHVAGRGLLAYLSQASFFFCLISPHNLITWPILNTGPLISCFAAKEFLKEESSKFEKQIGFALIGITLCYIFFHWRNL